MNREQLFQRIDRAWSAFNDSYAGLPESMMTAPGVVGDWSVKDILAHVTTWEEETLKYLPLIAEGGTPPKYASVGGIDAFNERAFERGRATPLSEVRRRLDETHRRLLDYLAGVPEDLFVRESRFRKRLRIDTYSHYPEHTEAIRAWRERQSADRSGV